MAGYALCQFEGGTIEQTVKEHGPMMGFSNAYDMIKQFSGKDYTTEKIHTWREMVPDANYELCVLAWDKNGVFQEITKVPVTTKKLGGPGEATVDIKIGEFGGSKKGGYYQDVVYSPNDFTATSSSPKRPLTNPTWATSALSRCCKPTIPKTSTGTNIA